jgi:glycosyltransferase involved in cell wall biosynthesis
VEDADLPGLYSGATAFLLPSLEEGFGLTALEAMACGTPVIASNAGALPETVGEAGILVSPLDSAAWVEAIARLLSDRKLQLELSRRGRERARRFSWEETAGRVWQVLEAASMSPVV